MAIFVSDAMSGTNWQDLHERSGEIGANWTRHPETGGSRWYIYDNKVHCGVAGALYAGGIPASADYSVACDYTMKTDIGHVGIAGRMSTTNLTFYYVYYLAGETVLARQVNGAITSLGAWISVLPGGGATYRLRLEMIGTAIKVFVDEVERISVVDSAITAAGRAAVRSPSVNDAQTGKHIDNFLATDTSVAPVWRSRVVGARGL